MSINDYLPKKTDIDDGNKPPTPHRRDSVGEHLSTLKKMDAEVIALRARNEVLEDVARKSMAWLHLTRCHSTTRTVIETKWKLEEALAKAGFRE